MNLMNYGNINMMGTNNQRLNQQNFKPMNDSFYNLKPFNQNINNHQNISVRFHRDWGANEDFTIQCNLEDTVSKIIQIYRKISGDFSLKRIFMFNGKILNRPSLSLANEGIANLGKIIVYMTELLKVVDVQ